MKRLANISILSILMLLVSILNVNAETTTISTKSLALYLGGPAGTEYTIHNPLAQSQTITISSVNENPYTFTGYVWTGGIYLNIDVEFPYTYYTQVNVTIPGQGTSTFSVNNGYAQIQMFIPMTTDKNLSVYITQQ